MIGILLVNLGTPEAPTTPAVRRYLREFLSDPRVVEIPRIKATGNAISASEVRRLLKTHQFSRIREIVPDTTFVHLETHYSAEVA